MANKQLVVNSDMHIDQKIQGLIGCIALEIEANLSAALKPLGLSNTQLMVMHALDGSGKDSMTVGEIKATMYADSPNVSRSINKLMENGLIKKERDLDDQRIVKIKLLEAGHKIHHEADKAALAKQNPINLTEDEKQTLYKLLQKL